MIGLARCSGLLALMVLLTGCVTREGIGFGTQPYINEHFAEYAALPPGVDPAETEDDEAPIERSSVGGAYVIGRTSAYREIRADETAREYEKYRRQFEKAWGLENAPAVSLESFSETIAGWTRIKVVGIPLIFAGYIKALVPKSIVDEIGFENSAATFLLQTSSDLVVARTNADGAFEIVGLLCEDKLGTSECTSNYRKGFFDSASGRELKGKLEFKEDGYLIDPVTYRVIEQAE